MKNRWHLNVLLRALRSPRRATPSAQEPIAEWLTDEEYYEEVSVRYGTAQILCIMLLAVFLCLSLITNTELLSADNLVYFAKDLTTSIASLETEARDTLVYAADKQNQFCLYRDGLAALGQNKLTVFTSTGREAYSYLLSYQTPRLAASGRYLMAYDLGGTQVSLYNSFTRVKQLTTSSPIRGVAISNQGYYCVITDGTESVSAVELYNERHRMVSRYSLQEYTVCADIRDDGNQIAIASLSTQNGRMMTHVALVAPKDSEWGVTWTVPDAYVMECHYTEDGNLMLVATNAIYWFSPTGDLLASATYTPQEALSYHADGQGCVLLSRANVYNDATRIQAFDKNGECVYNVIAAKEVSSASFDGTTLAVLCEDALMVYHPSAQEAVFVELKGNYHTLLMCEENTIMMCGEAKAITVLPEP